MLHVIDLHVAHLAGLPVGGYFHRNLLIQQRMPRWIPVSSQLPFPLLTRQQPVDRLGRNAPQLLGYFIAAVQLPRCSQFQLLPQHRRQPLAAGIVEDLPDLHQGRQHLHSVGRLPRRPLPAHSHFGRMGQLADQHLPVQMRALARFVQQALLLLLVGSPVFFP